MLLLVLPPPSNCFCYPSTYTVATGPQTTTTTMMAATTTVATTFDLIAIVNTVRIRFTSIVTAWLSERTQQQRSKRMHEWHYDLESWNTRSSRYQADICPGKAWSVPTLELSEHRLIKCHSPGAGYLINGPSPRASWAIAIDRLTDTDYKS